jgi:hypothetical protein
MALVHLLVNARYFVGFILQNNQIIPGRDTRKYALSNGGKPRQTEYGMFLSGSKEKNHPNDYR